MILTKSGFNWQDLAKAQPIIGLAPMDGVTDTAYRIIQKKYGQPDVVFTEFVNVEGLCKDGIKLMHHFVYQRQKEAPVIAQLYGKTPECFYQVALLVFYLGFDGVDINMGCPSKSVANNGAGAGLIKTPKLAKAIIQSVKKARDHWRAGANLDQAPDISNRIKQFARLVRQLNKLPHRVSYQERGYRPVSVKTRIGYDQPVTQAWISYLLETEIDALSLHGRTLRQAYRGQADWDEIGLAAALAREYQTVFLGNGDISSFEIATARMKQYQLDGVLIGRASFGNPYVFLPKDAKRPKSLFQIAIEHAYLYNKLVRLTHDFFDQVSPDEQIRLMAEAKLFLPMRKHLAWYVKGVQGAKKLRLQLVQTNSAAEAEQIMSQQITGNNPAVKLIMSYS